MNAPFEIAPAMARRAFFRLEKKTSLRFEIKNTSATEAAQIRLNANGEGVKWSQVLPVLKSNETQSFAVPVSSALRPGEYKVRIEAASGGRKTSGEFSYRIAPRRMEKLPVLLWGFVNEPYFSQQDLLDSGFTRVFDLYSLTRDDVFKNQAALMGDANNKALQKDWRDLDDALFAGLELAANVSGPVHVMGKDPAFARIQRDGTPYIEKPNVLALRPELKSFSTRMGQSLANFYGDHPAFTFANIYSESRDGSNLSFSEYDKEAWKKASGGLEIPEGVETKHTFPYSKIPNFPANRVVPDDHPILNYYSWYWKKGDGWTDLIDAVIDPLKAKRPDITTSFDPAVRVASVYGAGGNLDMIGHWTYTSPDPLRMAQTADQLLRMAQGGKKTIGKPHQTFLMMQLFWYRSQAAPANNSRPEARSYFDDHDPDAAYITIAPHILREALWVMLSRPVDMIGYHGQQSLWPSDGKHSYKYTNPQTQHELKRMHAKVVTPLGPTLQKIGSRQNDVAWLESFSSQILATRGTWGWGAGELGGRYRAALHAGLQPDVIYDETIREESLDRYKVLFLLGCDVLTQSVFEKIAAWQKRGGIVIGDADTCPAITPDMVVKPLTTPQREAMNTRADRSLDKTIVVEAAQELRDALKNKYAFFASSDDLDILTYVRQSEGVDYLFAINDKRRFGDYVGKFGIVREEGEPHSGTIRVARNARFAYDLVEGGAVPIASNQNAGAMKLDFEPSGGRLIALTNQEIGALKIDAPKQVRAGSTLSLNFQLQDNAQKPMRGVWPLHIKIIDPVGQRAEWSGYYGAQNGAQKITFDVAENDVSGAWTIRARDLAGRKTAVHTLRVEGGKNLTEKEIEMEKKKILAASAALLAAANIAQAEPKTAVVPTGSTPVATTPAGSTPVQAAPVTATPATVDAGEAITINASFEDKMKGWRTWTSDGSGKFEVVAEEARSGNNALKITGLKRGGPYQIFNWKAGKYYAIVRFKTPTGQTTNGTARLSVTASDEKSSPKGFETFQNKHQAFEAGKWHEWKQEFELKNDFEGKAKTVIALLTFNDFGPNDQIVIDDFGVYQVP